MYTKKQLDKAFNDFLSILNHKGGIDTFKFRYGFKTDFGLSKEEKEDIYNYLEKAIPKGCAIYRKVKGEIDCTEFLTTDYYKNPSPRQFKGAYYPVVLQTIGGIMAVSL